MLKLFRKGPVETNGFSDRPYQKEAIDAVWTGLNREHPTGMIALPTGAGKTVVFAKLATRYLPRRTLVLAHRDELITQAASKIEKIANVKPGIEKGRVRAQAGDTIVVGSVQSLMGGRSIKGERFGLCIIDEAHHAAAAAYRKVLSSLNPELVLGATATPYRTDRLLLSSVFERLLYSKTLLDLIREGYLTDIRVRTLPIPIDLSRVRMKQGDLNESDVGNALESAIERLADIVASQYRDRKLLAFCPVCETSRNWAAALQKRGLPAAHVDGYSEDRAQILNAFAKDDIRFLSNASLLTEGYDEASIDTVLILRPTLSRAMFSQMVGRGTRLFPGKKNVLILDPLFQTERNNPVSVGDLVTDDPKEAVIIESVMRNTNSRLSTAVDVREQVKETTKQPMESPVKHGMGLMKAIEAAVGREGYDLRIEDLPKTAGKARRVERRTEHVPESGLPAAFKGFADDVLNLFRKRPANDRPSKTSSP